VNARQAHGIGSSNSLQAGAPHPGETGRDWATCSIPPQPNEGECASRGMLSMRQGGRVELRQRGAGYTMYVVILEIKTPNSSLSTCIISRRGGQYPDLNALKFMGANMLFVRCLFILFAAVATSLCAHADAHPAISVE
jgi:hypothetical protein